MSNLYEKTSGMSVDMSTFAGLVSRLEAINNFIKDDMMKTMLAEIQKAEQPAGGGTLFGTSSDGALLNRKVGEARVAATGEITTLQTMVEQMIGVTKKIEQNYKTAEERNHQDAKAIERVFDEVKPPPVAPGAQVPPTQAGTTSVPGYGQQPK
ncbi:hypothetical protein [Longispora urticae]